VREWRVITEGGVTAELEEAEGVGVALGWEEW